MDAKNQEALTLGPEWMLAKFANLFQPLASRTTGVAIEKAVQGFKTAYGELSAGLDANLYFLYAWTFQRAWHTKTAEEKEWLSRQLTGILDRQTPVLTEEDWSDLPDWDTKVSPVRPMHPDDPYFRPAIVADFASGRLTIKPRTLLDCLANWLLQYGDKLALCDRRGCEHPYFVKTHARQRFCSHECANSVRETKKTEWWAENRDRFLKKWRAQRRAAKSQHGRRAKQ